MANLSFWAPQLVSDDASFRVWGQQIHDALDAAGWTFVDDTGHIDWATVARPGLNTIAGWEVWAMADALQATAPVYLVIGYGVGATASSKALTLKVGVATDGAGVLVGSQSNTFTVGGGNLAAGGPNLCVCVGDTNRFSMFQNALVGNGTSYGFAFLIERTKTAAGTDTTYGCSLFGYGGGTTTQKVWSRVFGEMSSVAGQKIGALAPSVGHGSTGAQTSVYPIFLQGLGPFGNPLMDLLGAWGGNVTDGVPFAVSHYGASRLYLPLSAASYELRVMGNILLSWLARYE